MIRSLIALTAALTLAACTEPDARTPVDEADVIACVEIAGALKLAEDGLELIHGSDLVGRHEGEKTPTRAPTVTLFDHQRVLEHPAGQMQAGTLQPQATL